MAFLDVKNHEKKFKNQKYLKEQVLIAFILIGLAVLIAIITNLLK